MRGLLNGICFVAVLIFSSRPAAAADIPSLSGTTVPSATQIVDMNLNVWTLSRGVAYENAQKTVSSGVILLLCYGGVVYQENSAHDWWLWDSNTDTWAASIDPRVISPGGTTIPVATQIIDSELDVWTLSGGQAYEHGQLTVSSGVILLLYAKDMVYQENIHHDWWFWRNGAWVATSAPTPPSANGTAIPAATQIVDNGRNVWTLSGGKAYENDAPTLSSDVILLLFYGGGVYQENVQHHWWEWNGQDWKSTASDPRVGQPLAYVASQPKGVSAVTVIDTGTNSVKATIPIGFEASYLAVTPDAKHVYVAGASNNAGGTVAVIDTGPEKVRTSISLPYVPQGIVASPDGTRVYVVSNSGYDFASGTITSTVSTIDTGSNVVVATVDTPDNDVGITISPDGKKLYLASGILCFCGSQLNGAWINVIDTASNSLVDQFLLYTQADSFGEFITTAVISPDNAKLYSNFSYYYPYVDQVAILNPETGAQTKGIQAVLTVQVFSPDSQRLYGVGLGGVGVIDTATDVSTTAVANIPGASDLAITPDGKHLYITDAGTNSVLVADTATYTISTVLPVQLAASGAIAIVSAH
jgi:YVTN family beta-propeller protein